jgi:hypothetical protein
MGKRHKTTTQDDPTNSDRAGWAEAALEGYRSVTRFSPANKEDLPDEIADLFCDLCHLARKEGFDPGELVERALDTFQIEEKEDQHGRA